MRGTVLVFPVADTVHWLRADFDWGTFASYRTTDTTVTVPAGTFGDVIAVGVSISGGMSLYLRWQEYYAPRVGLILVENVNHGPDGSLTTSRDAELVRYTVRVPGLGWIASH